MKRLFFCDFRNNIFKNEINSPNNSFLKLDKNMSSYLPYESSLLKAYFLEKKYFVKNYDFDILFKEYLENKNFNISFDTNKIINYLTKKEKTDFKVDQFLTSFDFKSKDIIFFYINQKEDIYMILLFCHYLKKLFKVKIILYGNKLDLDELIKLDYDSILFDWTFKKIENVITESKSNNSREEQLNLEFSTMPDFNDYSKKLYIKHTGAYRIPIKSQSGCKYNCAFCSWDKKKPIYQDIQKTVNKLKNLKEKYNPDYFVFKNNAINMSNKYLEDFLDFLIKENINITYSALAIVKKMNKGIIKKLSLSGCKFLGLGLEHSDKKMLKLMNKPSYIDYFKTLYQDCKSAKITTGIFYIINFPGENNKSIQKSLDFFKKYKENIILREFVLLKDSEIFKKSSNFEITKNLLGIKNYILNNKSYTQKIKMMSKRILIINGSPKIGNTNIITNHIQQIYTKNKIEHEIIDIKKLNIKYCQGCFEKCYETQKCIYTDMDKILEKIDSADGIIFVFPKYFGGIHSKFRNFIERTSPLMAKYFKNSKLQNQNNKPISIISLGNNNNENKEQVGRLFYEKYCRPFGWKLIDFKYYFTEINLKNKNETIINHPNLKDEIKKITYQIIKNN